MLILTRLLQIIDDHLGAGTSESFLDAFRHTPFADQIFDPSMPVTIPSDATLERIVRGYRNDSSNDVRFGFSLNLNANSTDDIFTDFCRATAHSNVVGDLRCNIGQLCGVYEGPRYFTFHGDGNCVLLGLIYQALSQHYGGDVRLVYTATPARDFMHVFAESGTTYFDPDQKATASSKEDLAPSAIIYQLLSIAGARVAEMLASSGRSWMLASMTWDYLSVFSSPDQPRIYKPNPTPAVVRLGFKNALMARCESLSMDVDDFPWKGELLRTMGSALPLLSRLGDEVQLSCRPGDVVRLGLREGDPAEILDLMSIYYGRMPLIVETEADESGEAKFSLPEVPWLIRLPMYCEDVMLNGVRFSPHVDARGNYRILGAGDLEAAGAHWMRGEPLSLNFGVPPDTLISTYLPFNARALRSGLLACRLDEGDC